MTVVLCATQSWGVIQDRRGNVDPDVPVTFDTTLYQDAEGTIPWIGTARTDASGRIPGYVEIGKHQITYNGQTYEIQAYSGATLVDLVASSEAVEKRVADVTAHGALGIGTDDGAAIQAAIDFIAAAGGGTVYFPPSESGYGVTPVASGGLSVPSGVTLRGTGYAGRIKRLGGASGDILIASENVGSGTVADDNIELRDLWIDGGGADPDNQPTCVSLGSQADGPIGTGYVVEGCTFANWTGPVIALHNAAQFRVTANRIDTAARGGIVIWFGSHDGVIADNTVVGGGDDCIAVNSDAGVQVPASQPTRIAITGNALTETAGDTCIALRGASDCAVVGNTCDGSAPGHASIQCEEATTTATFHNQRIVIAGNTVRNAAGYGIAVAGAVVNDMRIADNIVSGTDKAGVWLFQGATDVWENIAVDGNTLIDNGGATVSDAIFLQVVAGATIAFLSICHNVILRSYGTAILMDGDSAVTGLRVNGNFIRDPNQGSLASTPAIALQGCTNFQVLDNMVAVGVAPATKANWALRIVTGDRGLVGRLFALSSNFGAGALQILSTNTIDNGGHQTGATAPATVASAATVTLPVTGRMFTISGTTTITSITASWPEREVTLRFSGAAAVTDGGNLKLASSLPAAANQTLTLICDGTNWWEIARAAT